MEPVASAGDEYVSFTFFAMLQLVWLNLIFYIHRSVHRELNLIIVQQGATYSVYYISVGNSTCFGCWHPSSAARTAVITASGTGQPGATMSTTIRSRC